MNDLFNLTSRKYEIVESNLFWVLQETEIRIENIFITYEEELENFIIYKDEKYFGSYKKSKDVWRFLEENNLVKNGVIYYEILEKNQTYIS